MLDKTDLLKLLSMFTRVAMVTWIVKKKVFESVDFIELWNWSKELVFSFNIKSFVIGGNTYYQKNDNNNKF